MQISTGFASWQRYCTASSSGRTQPNVAALNRERHLCSAGRPSRWALAHILVVYLYYVVHQNILENCQCNFVHLTAVLKVEFVFKCFFNVSNLTR